jgi:hypothetical protein
MKIIFGEWSRGESNPLESGDSSIVGGGNAQIDAQNMDSDRQILTCIVEVWPTLEKWRKRAILEISQAVPVCEPNGTGKLYPSDGSREPS